MGIDTQNLNMQIYYTFPSEKQRQAKTHNMYTKITIPIPIYNFNMFSVSITLFKQATQWNPSKKKKKKKKLFKVEKYSMIQRQ